MAAIICKPIGSFIEFVCTAPCKLCAKLCAGGCKSLCTNPLSAYVVVTLLTQIPVVVAGALELGGLRLGSSSNGNGGCKGSEWLLGMLLVALVHMATSVYLSYRVTNGTDEALRDRHTSWDRIAYLLCHDPWIAFYILVCAFYVAWLCVGSVWSFQGIMDDSGSDDYYNDMNNNNNSESNCGNDVEDRVAIALGFGWFFLFFGPTVLSCNLCCVCCDKNDYAADDAAFEQKTAAKAAAAAAAQANKNKNKRNSNNNSNSNYNAEDIETPNPPPQSPSQSEPKMRTNQPEQTPPRTYSVDGVPISDINNNNNNNKSYSNSNNAIPAEAVAEEILPPAMMPPAMIPSKAEDIVDSVTKTVDSVTKSVGGWFSGGSNKKGGDPKQPDVKATVY